MRLFKTSSFICVLGTVFLSSPVVLAQQDYASSPCPGYSAGQFYGPGWSEQTWLEMRDNPQSGNMIGRGYGRHMSNPKMARVIDENQDGLIGEDEAAVWHEDAFSQMDQDEDDSITKEEFIAARLGPGANRALSSEQQTRHFLRKQTRFEAMDSDNDGKINLAEFLASGKQRYQASDLDGDGEVTVWEFRAHRRHMM